MANSTLTVGVISSLDDSSDKLVKPIERTQDKKTRDIGERVVTRALNSLSLAAGALLRRSHLSNPYHARDPSVIYADELGHLNYGLPLWEPNACLVGVGWLHKGSFVRLFNAIRPDTDPVEWCPRWLRTIQSKRVYAYSSRQHLFW